MSLRDTLAADMKEAMKAKEEGKLRLAVIRMAWSGIRNKEIDEKRELTDEEILALLMKEVKQREDSIEEFKAAGREELVSKNEEEILILKKYLPAQLSDDELKKIVQDTITAVGAASIKDMGKVMGGVMGKAKGRADGKRINSMVKELLK